VGGRGEGGSFLHLCTTVAGMGQSSVNIVAMKRNSYTNYSNSDTANCFTGIIDINEAQKVFNTSMVS
jgi:hypothetical protein